MTDQNHALPLEVALDRHWDAVLSGASSSLLDGTDPGLAATVRRVHALDNAADPRPNLAATLWEDLMASQTSSAPITGPPGTFPRPILKPESGPWRVATTPDPIPRIAAAILLIALLGGSLIAALSPHWPRLDNRVPLVAPAAEQTTETLGVISETLVDLGLSEEAPFSAWVFIDHYLYPAGSGSREATGETPYVFLVREGRLTLRVAGPTHEVQIVRPGMNGQLAGDGLLSPDSDISLEAGTAVVIPAATEFELTNSADTPAHLLTLLSGAGHTSDSWGGVNYESSTSSGGNLRQLSSEFALSLELVTLAPDAALPEPAAGTIREAASLQPGRIMDLRIGGDRSLRNGGDEPLMTYVLTVAGETLPAIAQADGASRAAATPEHNVSSTTLLDLTIPEMSPGRAFVQADRYTLPPGTSLPSGTRNAPTIDVYFIVDGSLNVSASEAPRSVEIVRLGGAETDAIASGETAEVGPGDAVLVPGGSEASLGNSASTPAIMLRLIQPSAAQMSLDTAISLEFLGNANVHDLTAPLTLTLQLVNLGSGASFAAADAPDAKRVLAALDPDRVTDMRIGSDGSVRNAGDEPLEVYVLTVVGSGEAIPAIPAATAAAAGTLELLWESTGGPDQLLSPYGIGIAPDGDIWVADSTNDRFQILAPDGTYVETWGSRGHDEGEFEFLSPRAAFGAPYGDVAFDANGNIYVVDTGNFRVQKFAPDRSFTLAWGSEGEGNGQFLAASSIAIGSDGTIYVGDETRHDIQKFDRDGTWLGTIGQRGTAEGQFDTPAGVAIDSAGNLWVAEFNNHRVQRLGSEGEPLAAWGQPGTGEGEFSNPNDVAVDRLNRVFVADQSNNRLQVFADDGRFLAETGDAFGPDGLLYATSVAVNQDGIVFVVYQHGVKAYRLLLPAGDQLAT
jgi:DNA-binding beta-propeller fold protein YncE/mannose-6-phosphate isomerase-like protein (cupin superfamily)